MTHNSNARKARADEPLFGGFGGAYEHLIDQVFCDFDIIETDLRTLLEHGRVAPPGSDIGMSAQNIQAIRSHERDIMNAIRNLRALAAASRSSR
jgi:hypothetical protein